MISYERDPQQPAATIYNWLRHAGTIHALCELYTATKDGRYRDAARRAAVHLVDQLQTVTIRGQSCTRGGRFRVC